MSCSDWGACRLKRSLWKPLGKPEKLKFGFDLFDLLLRRSKRYGSIMRQKHARAERLPFCRPTRKMMSVSSAPPRTSKRIQILGFAWRFRILLWSPTNSRGYSREETSHSGIFKSEDLCEGVEDLQLSEHFHQLTKATDTILLSRSLSPPIIPA